MKQTVTKALVWGVLVLGIILIFSGVGMLVTAYENPHSSESTIVTEFVNTWNQLYYDTFSSFTVKLEKDETTI